MPKVYDTRVGPTLDLILPFAMRAGHKKPPTRHWNTESAFAIVTDDDHPLRIWRRFILRGACDVRRAFHFCGEIIFRLNVKRGSASITDQQRLALRDGENRNKEESEILPEAVLTQVGQ